MNLNELAIFAIAALAHSMNMAYCRALGDHSHLPWADAPSDQKESVIAGVRMHLANPNATPEELHAAWLAQKLADGWTHGDVKDIEAKTHPSCLPYDELPEAQRVKDYLFKQAVHSAAELYVGAQADGDRAARRELALAQAATQTASPAGGDIATGVAVRYIGFRDNYTDKLYHSNLTFTKGQVRRLPSAHAYKLLRHTDMFERADDELAAIDSDVSPELEKAERDKADKIEAMQRENDLLDSITQMSTKKAVIEFAMTKYGMKLEDSQKLGELKEQAGELVKRFGVPA